MEYENIRAELLEVQLVIGKAVVESMLDITPRKCTVKQVIPVTFDDKEFEVEARMK